MNPFIVIALTLALGLVLQFSRLAGDRAAARLNAYVINVALPCLILYEMPRLTLDARALLPVATAWVVMTLTALIVWQVARLAKWSTPVTGCLLLLLPLGNTGFVGIPLINALVGKDGVGYAILYDQFGTFLALNTFGIIIAAGFGGAQSSAALIARKIITFPPFLSLLLAIVVLAFNLPYPAALSGVLRVGAQSLVPVVMVAVGISWHLQLERHHIVIFGFGLAVLLLVKPLLAWAVATLLGGDGMALTVVVLEAGMPAMISAGALAMRYNLAPRLAASLVGYSLPVGIASLFLWRALLAL